MFALHFRSSLIALHSFFLPSLCSRFIFAIRSSLFIYFFYQAYVRALFSPFITSHHLPHPAYFRGFFLHFFLLLVASPVSRRNIGSLDWPENFRSHLLPLILWGCHFCLTSNFANHNSRFKDFSFSQPCLYDLPALSFLFHRDIFD